MAAENANKRTQLWTPAAWIAGQWHQDVLLCTDHSGVWQQIATNIARTNVDTANTTVLNGPVLPGLCNAHSHAFQRAMAGLAERSSLAGDNFWSWRDRMYTLANRVSPDQLQVIAAQLYIELLKSGYTQVCEFHYLHHDVAGPAFAQPYVMMDSLANAAAQAGMGLTLLPTLYMRAGFAKPDLRDDQQRFGSTPEWIASAAARYVNRSAVLHSGVALHSLRAVAPESILALLNAIPADSPVHIHIAEQMIEVNECVAQNGTTPIAWALENLPVNQRWHLAHATHATAQELQGIARSGASVVICPSTEANLGDGLFDFSAYQHAAGIWSIGSDSHVTRSASEELRWLEYGQRLRHQARNVAAGHTGYSGHAGQQTETASVLFASALKGGAAAAGLPLRGLQVGERADFVVLDKLASPLLGVSLSHLLDAWLFSSDTAACVREVYVAGERVIAEGRHAHEPRVAQEFTRVMRSLWS